MEMPVQAPRLTAAQCREHATDCEKMAQQSTVPEHRVMLRHMAETWKRMATDVETDDAR
jgi:hypothetical protein